MAPIEIFKERVICRFAGIPLTDTELTTVAVTASLLVCAAAVRHSLQTRPDGYVATAATFAFNWLDDLVTQIVGVPTPWLVCFSGSLFFLIAACNILGQLPGVRTPVADLATTSALAVLVFLAVPAAGIRALGLGGYLRHYLRPNPILLPLHLLSELSRTFALSVRLFGNMMSGYLIVAILVALAGIIVPVPLMALDLLIGLLQAYIFAVLATVYIGAAIRAGEE